MIPRAPGYEIASPALNNLLKKHVLAVNLSVAAQILVPDLKRMVNRNDDIEEDCSVSKIDNLLQSIEKITLKQADSDRDIIAKHPCMNESFSAGMQRLYLLHSDLMIFHSRFFSAGIH